MVGTNSTARWGATAGSNPFRALWAARVVAVDVGASHVACGVFSVLPENRLALRRFAFEHLDADPANDTSWADDVARTLKLAAAKARIRGAISLAVPGHLALTKIITAPSVEKSKREKIIRFEASQSIPYRLEDVIWDHLVLADEGQSVEVLLAAVKTDALQTLCAATKAAGMTAEHTSPSSITLHRAFRFNYPEIEACVLLANIGARTTQLIFIQQERFAVRTVPLAGNTVTQAIADALQVGFAEAEALKLEVLSGACGLPTDSSKHIAVRKAAENFCVRLVAEIGRSSLSLRRHADAGEPTAVFVAGGGSRLLELPEVIGEGLKLPVTRYDPLKRVIVSLIDGGAVADRAHIPGELVGLAAMLGLPSQRSINLLPSEEKRQLAFRRNQPATLVAAALLTCALLPPLWHYRQIDRATKSELSKVELQLKPLRQRERERTRQRARIEQLKSQAAVLDRIERSRTSWLNFLADLQRRLADVQDVWLDELTVLPIAAREGQGGTAGVTDAPMQIRLSGRLLDRENPVSKVSEASYTRVKRLLRGFAECRSVALVGGERFDNTVSGILRFDVTLTMSTEDPL